MLYNEFINGTGAPDNVHTYEEFKRIEAIYNADNSLSKADAYAMYQKPLPYIAELMESLEESRDSYRDLCKQFIELTEENKRLQSSLNDLLVENNDYKYKLFRISETLRELGQDINRSIR